jgi:hypothetical protein
MRISVPLLALPGRASDPLRRAPVVLASALLAFASGGCETSNSPDIGSPDTAIRIDSAGVMLVKYPGLPPIEASRIAIADEPDLVLGDGGDVQGLDHDFFQIAGVSQLRDGTLVVANSGSRELRFYGADGQLLRSVGRGGDGPGEFRGMQGLWIMAGDTVVVWDRTLSRLQHFSPEGDFVRSTPIVQTPFSAGFSGLRPQPQAVLEDGLVAVFVHSPHTATQRGVQERPPVLVALHRPGDGGWDSVQVVPGNGRILAMGDDGELRSRDYYFPGYPVVAGAGTTLAVADAERFRVELFDPEGRLISVFSASVPEIPVTADVIEAQLKHMADQIPAGASDEWFDRIRTAAFANHAPSLPKVWTVFVDADERVWVERYDVPGVRSSRWEVFARDGTWVGRVEVPEGFERGTYTGSFAPSFSVRSGRLAGAWKDPDTGVETVRIYRVIEPGSGVLPRSGGRLR